MNRPLRVIHGELPEARLAALPLRVYLLGVVDHGEMLALQHRLVEDVAAGGTPALVLCEHAQTITVGRRGSHTHIDLDLNPPGQRWKVRWVNRGGGCWVHTPGQLAVYALLPLDRLGLSLAKHRDTMLSCVRNVVEEHAVVTERRGSELLVGSRPVACFGAALREETTYFGAILNVNPDLTPFRHVRTGDRHAPMTSVQRECRRLLRLSYLRERLVEHFCAAYQLGEPLCFTGHPFLSRKAASHAYVAAR
jgi:lipoyl(octanoyl) transferase